MTKNTIHIIPIELLTKYFATEATAEERKIVERWRDKNSESQKEFNVLEKLWNSTGSLAKKEDINVESEWNKLAKTLGLYKTRVMNIKRVLQIAASVLIISTLALFGTRQYLTITEKAPIAEVAEVSLPDGSKISLNAGSKIHYRKGFGSKHRYINLTGEAFFEVKSNTGIPFIIAAHDARIEVTGTKFNVKAYKKENNIKVTVTEGKVKLYNKKRTDNKTMVSKGQWGSYNKNTKTINKEATQNMNNIAWKTHKINFHNTTLKEAAQILSNVYHYEIQLHPDIQDYTITVNFDNQDLHTILQVLKSTLDLHISIEGKRVTITGEGC